MSKLEVFEVSKQADQRQKAFAARIRAIFILVFLVGIMSISASYLSLQNHLEALVQSLCEGVVDKNVGTKLLNFWLDELAPIEGDVLSPKAYNQWRSLHTELHRELRLLNMDLMFLGNSRSAPTQAMKKQATRDRLEKLVRYCQQIREIIASDDQHKPEV